jgi:hypothetical protein
MTGTLSASHAELAQILEALTSLGDAWQDHLPQIPGTTEVVPAAAGVRLHIRTEIYCQDFGGAAFDTYPVRLVRLEDGSWGRTGWSDASQRIIVPAEVRAAVHGAIYGPGDDPA